MAEPMYTLGEAAGLLGVHEEALSALLPDAGLDLAGRDPQALTLAEVQRLSRLFDRIIALVREEDPYSPS